MKPTTRFQKKVTEFKALLSPVTEKQEIWATKNIFECYGVVSRNKHVCLECNHVWKQEEQVKNIVCPECKSKLKIFGQNDTFFTDRRYFSIVETVKDLQVVRFVYSIKTMKKDKTPSYSYTEVMQHWINDTGETVSLAKSVHGYSNYIDAWLLSTPMTIKIMPQDTGKFRITPEKVYPVKKVLPIFKRNGFKSSFHDIAPQLLFTYILKDSIAETILKSGQINLLNHYIYYRNTIKNNWNPIKVCLKNNYKAVDWQIWEDFIDLLREFDKDLYNPDLVCPKDLKQAHDYYMHLQATEKEKENSLSNEELFERYTKQKSKYFDLVFKEKEITIYPLKTLKEFKKEGKILNHCIFRNKYFKKKDSLIFSAKIDDKPIETIEISLSKMQVNQSRGLDNVASEYNERILNLVNKNIYKIKRLSKQQKQVA